MQPLHLAVELHHVLELLNRRLPASVELFHQPTNGSAVVFRGYGFVRRDVSTQVSEPGRRLERQVDLLPRGRAGPRHGARRPAVPRAAVRWSPGVAWRSPWRTQ